MSKKTNKKPTIYLGILIFCIIGTLVGIIDKQFAMFATYLVLAIIFYVLWYKKKKTYMQEPHPVTNKNSEKRKANVNVTEQQKKESQKSTVDIKYEHHHVTGTSHYLDNILSLGFENDDYTMKKSEILENYFDGDKIYQIIFNPVQVELLEEPENPYDANAIKVIIDGQLVGYIKKGSCSHIKNLIHTDCIKKISADIHGGKYKQVYEEFDDDKADYVMKVATEESNYFVDITIHLER